MAFFRELMTGVIKISYATAENPIHGKRISFDQKCVHSKDQQQSLKQMSQDIVAYVSVASNPAHNNVFRSSLVESPRVTKEMKENS